MGCTSISKDDEKCYKPRMLHLDLAKGNPPDREASETDDGHCTLNTLTMPTVNSTPKPFLCRF